MLGYGDEEGLLLGFLDDLLGCLFGNLLDDLLHGFLLGGLLGLGSCLLDMRTPKEKWALCPLRWAWFALCWPNGY